MKKQNPNQTQEQHWNEQLGEAREQMRRHALDNPVDPSENLDAMLAAYIRFFPFNTVMQVSVILMIVADERGENLVWHAQTAFHYKPQGNTKRVMFWTNREKEKAKELLKFFLAPCGAGDTKLSWSGHNLSANRKVSDAEWRHIFEPEKAEAAAEIVPVEESAVEFEGLAESRKSSAVVAEV